MPVILALGSNQGDRLHFLNAAIDEIRHFCHLESASRVYQSEAILYRNQPDFLNQVIQVTSPPRGPLELLRQCLNVEQKLGRRREMAKGPRFIDIDLIFFDFLHLDTPELQLPHPAWHNRHFVVAPLQELPFFSQIEENYKIAAQFDHTAVPFSAG